jgi:hypothetical protein
MGPDLPRLGRSSVLVEDADLETGKGLADAAWLAQPLLGGDDGAHALAGAVVLPDGVRGEHVHDLPLHGLRARCRRVEDLPHARQVIRLPALLGHLEDADEVRRHHVGVGDPMPVDERERLLRVPARHDDDRSPLDEVHLGVGTRSRVIGRTTQQMDVVGSEPPRLHVRLWRGFAGGFGDGPLDPLRPAGRAGRVVHPHDRGAEEVLRGGEVGAEIGIVGADQCRRGALDAVRGRLRRGVVGVGEHLRTGVHEQVADLAQG